jgi:cytochrome c556
MSIRATVFATAAIAAAIATGTAFAADPIETRKATMKAVGGAFGGVLVKMVKGETPYDAAAAKAAAATIVEKANAFDVAAFYPKGTETGGDTSASPKIWADMAGFKSGVEKFRVAAAAQAPNADKGLDQLKAMVGELGKSCKGCHDEYRVQKP